MEGPEGCPEQRRLELRPPAILVPEPGPEHERPAASEPWPAWWAKHQPQGAGSQRLVVVQLASWLSRQARRKEARSPKTPGATGWSVGHEAGRPQPSPRRALP